MSFQELAVVFVLGLLVLGPERLPRVARRVGGWIGRARRTANDLRYLLEREIALEDADEFRRGRARSTEARDDRSDVNERGAG